MSIKIRSAVVLFALLLSACSNDNESAAPAQSNAPAKAVAANSVQFRKGAVVTHEDFAKEGVTLSVAPNPYRSCDFPKGQAVVTVGYDARPAGINHVQIWVQRSNGHQDLWGQSPGSSPPTPTGKWMDEGSRLLLVDLNAGELIAATTVHAAPCP